MLPIFSTIIAQKLATYHELKYVYYYEEALDLYEIILVNNYNEMAYNRVQELNAEAGVK